jgi:hypothetical protein
MAVQMLELTIGRLEEVAMSAMRSSNMACPDYNTLILEKIFKMAKTEEQDINRGMSKMPWTISGDFN